MVNAQNQNNDSVTQVTQNAVEEVEQCVFVGVQGTTVEPTSQLNRVRILISGKGCLTDFELRRLREAKFVVTSISKVKTKFAIVVEKEVA